MKKTVVDHITVSGDRLEVSAFLARSGNLQGIMITVMRSGRCLALDAEEADELLKGIDELKKELGVK